MLRFDVDRDGRQLKNRSKFRESILFLLLKNVRMDVDSFIEIFKPVFTNLYTLIVIGITPDHHKWRLRVFKV